MMEILDILSELADTRKSAIVQIYTAVAKEFNEKPSSVKYHHIEAGGMGRHVKEVMNIALQTFDLNPAWYQVPRDSVAIVGFIHDFSKLGRYIPLPAGDWRRQPKYGAAQFEYDKNKVYLNETAEVVHLCATGGLTLTREEINAVTFHHGAWAESARDNPMAMDQMTAFAVLIHFADMLSCKVYDVRK